MFWLLTTDVDDAKPRDIRPWLGDLYFEILIVIHRDPVRDEVAGGGNRPIDGCPSFNRRLGFDDLDDLALSSAPTQARNDHEKRNRDQIPTHHTPGPSDRFSGKSSTSEVANSV